MTLMYGDQHTELFVFADGCRNHTKIIGPFIIHNLRSFSKLFLQILFFFISDSIYLFIATSWLKSLNLQHRNLSDMASTTMYHSFENRPTTGWKIPNVYSPLRYGGYSTSLDNIPWPWDSVRRPLTGEKEVLYNPHLPSLRRMDMDEVLQKLPDQHSRHTTPCAKGIVIKIAFCEAVPPV